jgi:hypothetical protein
MAPPTILYGYERKEDAGKWFCMIVKAKEMEKGAGYGRFEMDLATHPGDITDRLPSQ